MTELLQAVLDRPQDDLPRLVLADWLDQHGDVYRAEFIRCEIAVHRWANTPSHLLGGSREDGGPAGAALATSQNLWSEHWRKWLPTGIVGCLSWWPFDPKVLTGRFVRGFINEIRGPLADLLKIGPAICREHPVEKVLVMDRQTFKSGGNDTYYIGGYDPMPPHMWEHLDGHRSPQAAMTALNAAVLSEIKDRSKTTEPRGRGTRETT